LLFKSLDKGTFLPVEGHSRDDKDNFFRSTKVFPSRWQVCPIKLSIYLSSSSWSFYLQELHQQGL